MRIIQPVAGLQRAFFGHRDCYVDMEFRACLLIDRDSMNPNIGLCRSSRSPTRMGNPHIDGVQTMLEWQIDLPSLTMRHPSGYRATLIRHTDRSYSVFTVVDDGTARRRADNLSASDILELAHSARAQLQSFFRTQ
jgi:hypothetical protein